MQFQLCHFRCVIAGATSVCRSAFVSELLSNRRRLSQYHARHRSVGLIDLMMLRTLIIAIFAGAIPATADHLECPRYQQIVNTCVSQHLSYITSDVTKTALQSVKEITDPTFLIIDHDFDAICKDSDHLKMYFECLFTNLTECLEDLNKTDINLPFPDIIAKGVYDLCAKKEDINGSCVAQVRVDVEKCFGESTAMGEEQCSLQERLVQCTEDFTGDCQGGPYVYNYVKASKPQVCGTAAGARMVATMFTTLLALLAAVVVPVI